MYANDAVLLPPECPGSAGPHWIRFLGRTPQGLYPEARSGVRHGGGRGDLVYNVGHYRFTAVPKDRAHPGMADEGKFVGILKKQPDGSWKHAVYMYNPTSPACAKQAVPRPF